MIDPITTLPTRERLRTRLNRNDYDLNVLFQDAVYDFTAFRCVVRVVCLFSSLFNALSAPKCHIDEALFPIRTSFNLRFALKFTSELKLWGSNGHY